VQLAVCAALARDLDLDYDELVSALPRAKTSSRHLWDPNGSIPRNQYGPRGATRVGMGNTDEEVR
jgi:hypothetical protein